MIWNFYPADFYICTFSRVLGTTEICTFDLSTDIGEQNDVAASNPKLVAEMEKHWQAYAQENNVVLPENFIPYGYLPDK